MTTLYYTSHWLDVFENLPAFLNYLIYSILLVITLSNFLSSMLIGPGHVPDGWMPDNEEDCQLLQFCDQCDAYKAPRSHHCSRCEKCILKMDHHCPWINNCCGFRNQKFFFYFLFGAVVGSIHSSILLAITLYRVLTLIPNKHYQYIRINLYEAFIILISIGMSLGVIIAVGILLFIQAKIIWTNQTSIENWIIKKANTRSRTEPFIYPYDLGFWENIKQVLFDKLGDGIYWKVKKGCDQYTLTYEQLLQKKNKLQNAFVYMITTHYNGKFFPIFSQGIRVCLKFPINDDPRLIVEPDDEIMVTHANDRWLYGFKINSKKKIKEKGWFPKQCGVIVAKPRSFKSSSIDDKIDDEILSLRSKNNDNLKSKKKK